jgi:hypothetical protein
MLATSVKRRLFGALVISSIVYSLVVALGYPGEAARLTPFQGPITDTSWLEMEVGVSATTTASPNWAATGWVDWPTAGWGVGFQPGESPELRILGENYQVWRRRNDAVGTQINYMRDARGRMSVLTLTFEPQYSPDTDIFILSGTALPHGWKFPKRGGLPGNSGQNPSAIFGNPDAGTATARACVSTFLASTCIWPGALPTGVNLAGCPGWNTTGAAVRGNGDSPGGVPHIWEITNAIGPYPTPWDGANHPKGELYDRRRARWAYAKIQALGCARATVVIVTQDVSLYVPIYVYRDDPVPGAYSLVIYFSPDTRLGGPQPDPATNYKTCGGTDNPCFALHSLGVTFHTFAGTEAGQRIRLAQAPKACGFLEGRLTVADDVSEVGSSPPWEKTYYGQAIRAPSNNYPNCPPALRGTVAHSSGRALQNAYVYAFDANTGRLVNAPPAAGATTASASVPCRGGALPNDPPTGPVGPAAGTATSSYGCARIRGNTGFHLQNSPGIGDPRWYIRGDSGVTSYKVLVSSPPGDGNVSRWAASTPPASGINDWNTATVWTANVGASPTVVGDNNTVTTTLSPGNPIQGSVTRNGAWTVGTDRGAVYVWDGSGQQFEATWTALTGGGTYNVDVRASTAKVRFQVADGAGNPDLVGWYSGSATPAPNFSTGATVTPPANLVTTNFTSGTTISGQVLLGGSPPPPTGPDRPVYVYRNSDGQLVYIASAVASQSGNYAARVPSAASAYKLFAPGDSTYQGKWYNQVDTWTAASLVSAPSTGINFNLPTGSTISGSVTRNQTAADGANGSAITWAPVYVYNASTGAFVTQGTTGNTGNYTLVVPAGSYKVYTTGSPVRESLWNGGALSYGEAVAVAAPATVNFSLLPADYITGRATQNGNNVANTLISAFVTDGRLAGNVLSDATGGTSPNYSIKLATTTASGRQYKLRFIPATGQTRWYNNQTSFAAANPVNSPATGINQETPP